MRYYGKYVSTFKTRKENMHALIQLSLKLMSYSTTQVLREIANNQPHSVYRPSSVYSPTLTDNTLEITDRHMI